MCAVVTLLLFLIHLVKFQIYFSYIVRRERKKGRVVVHLSLWLTDFERNVLDKEREGKYSLKRSFLSFSLFVLFLGFEKKWRRSWIYRVGNWVQLVLPFCFLSFFFCSSGKWLKIYSDLLGWFCYFYFCCFHFWVVLL